MFRVSDALVVFSSDISTFGQWNARRRGMIVSFTVAVRLLRLGQSSHLLRSIFPA